MVLNVMCYFFETRCILVCCEAVRSPVLATAWLLVLFLLSAKQYVT